MRKSKPLHLALLLACLWGLCALGVAVAADDAYAERPLQRVVDALPASVSDGLELDGWLWLSDLQNNFHPPSNYFDAVLSLEVTKRFDQRIAITAQGNFISAAGTNRAELEQGFI